MAPAEAARRLYPGADIPMSTKAAIAPAMTGTAGFAQELTLSGNANVLPALAPASGYAQLVPRGVRVTLSGLTRLPRRTSGVLPVKFVAEGRQFRSAAPAWRP